MDVPIPHPGAPPHRSPGDVRRIAARVTGAAAIVGPTLLIAGGCETYRIEYHRRPAFYQDMSDDALPERVVLDDGTVVVYSQDRNRDWLRAEAEREDFELRAENEDGTISLRAILPEHVISHALDCIRRGEYRLMWDELVAERTRQAYAAEGQGYEEFEAYISTNAVPLARMLNRMSLGINMHECAQGYVDGVYRVQFNPRVTWNTDGTRQFEYDKVDMVQEAFQLKLVLIH